MNEIEDMFRSGNKELIKLAQRICHQKRISYYIYTNVYNWMLDNKWLAKEYVNFYSLNQIKYFADGYNMYSKYKIDLK